MDKAQMTKLAVTATASATCKVTGMRNTAYPYNDFLSKKNFPAFAKVVEIETAGKKNTVVISYFKKEDGGDEYNVWCSDRLLEGKVPKDQAEVRTKEAMTTVGLVNPTVEAEMVGQWDSSPSNERCNFWSLWKKDKTLCNHTNHALNHLQAANPAWMDELTTGYATMMTGASAPAATGGVSLSAMAPELVEYAFRCPILFEGDRGSGKTHSSRAFARNNGFSYIEVGGNEGIEAPDLLGYLVPHGAGQLIWKDGPLARAFRLAGKGEKVVLLLDELLRIPQRHLSVLLSALSPDEGKYRLNTSRIVDVIDEVGVEEVLEAPVENLCIIATTNVGSEFAVDMLDPAIAERFQLFRMDTDVSKLTAVLKGLASDRGFTAAVTKKLIEFFNSMIKLRAAGTVNRLPTVRTLARAVLLATNEPDVKRQLSNMVLLWIDRNSDGFPVKEQKEQVEKALARIFV